MCSSDLLQLVLTSTGVLGGVNDVARCRCEMSKKSENGDDDEKSDGFFTRRHSSSIVLVSCR